MLTHLSTFSGIEGIGLAAEAEGFRAVGHCDIEPFAREVIRHHWPDTPIWWDIRHMNRRRLIKKLVKQGVLTRDPRFGSLVDLLSGGFPCQPFSLAGQQKGELDARHLFPELARFIREIRPRWFLLENVPGLFSANSGRVFRDVLGAMAAMGYRVGWCCYGAGEVGAPHRRERVFIIGCLAAAEQERSGGQQDAAGRNGGNGSEAGREEGAGRAEQRCEDGAGDVADAECAERRPAGARLSGLDGGFPGLHAGRQEGAGRPEQRGAEGQRTAGVSHSDDAGLQVGRETMANAEIAPSRGLPVGAAKTQPRPAFGGAYSGNSETVADADGNREQQPAGHVGEEWGWTGDGGAEVADAEEFGHHRRSSETSGEQEGEGLDGGPEGRRSTVANTHRQRLAGVERGVGQAGQQRSTNATRGPGAENRQSGATESCLGGVADELPARMDLDSWPGWPAGPGQEQNPWEPPRVAQGVQDRVARLKGLGNAVSPHQVRPILRAIRAAAEVERASR